MVAQNFFVARLIRRVPSQGAFNVFQGRRIFADLKLAQSTHRQSRCRIGSEFKIMCEQHRRPQRSRRPGIAVSPETTIRRATAN